MRAMPLSLADTSESDVVLRAEALLDACRPRQLQAYADRWLQRSGLARDEEACLRVGRSLALWLSGARAARAELARAAALAQGPHACAALRQARALFAWREMDFASAWSELGGDPQPTRGLWIEAGLLKDEGRLAAALERLGAGIALAEQERRPAWAARLLADRAGVHLTQGRWTEARRDALAARAGFRDLADPREITVAGLAECAIDLALGDLADARARLESARTLLASHPADPRAQAELQLLESDLRLSAGDANAAAAAAARALTLFGVARDARGLCLAHVRQAHALVSGGRIAEALAEARRAVRAAGEAPTQLQAWAELVLGRVLLRLQPDQAVARFERAAERAGERVDLRHLARLGAALGRRDGRQSTALREPLDGLVAWGDRRILAFGVADVRDRLGATSALPAQRALAAAPTLAIASARERALVDAAVAVAAPGAWPSRWAGAMRALRPALEWTRAALVTQRGGLELRADLEDPLPLADDEFLLPIARRISGPTLLDLAAERDAAEHPARLLHSLRGAALAPLPERAALCLAFRREATESDVALVAEAARLIAPHVAEVGTAAEAAESDASPFPEIVGRCAPMRALFADMLRVAGSEAFVHLAGETGTGKDKVAHALHACSRRRGGRFVALNASSLSDELFESEMFGHARGAFTGAQLARDGYVAEAEAGTLFIDEVADLSLRAQAKLLRLLQAREYRRLGETELRRADIRVVTAANVDLEQRVAQGSFREDLMYRIAVVTLRLPPLRERGDDVLLLARHFLRAAARKDGCTVPGLGVGMADALLRHAWPGNVRELENEMTRLVALGGGQPLPLELLSRRIGWGRGAADRPIALREGLLNFERGFLERALARHRGNRSRTAVELGITRQALLGKMARLGLC
jgi:DNA-binding NtrC family response regulator